MDREQNVEREALELAWLDHTSCSIRPPFILEKRFVRFNLGRISTSLGALSAFSQGEIDLCLRRHASGDWGDSSAEDRLVNDAALDPANPARVMSVYKFPDNRVLWVITEYDRSETTVLLPEDY